MALIEKSTPYEFLIRWNKDGSVSGAHVQFLDAIEKNGVTLTEKVGPAIPVSMAGGKGFPLTDILSTVHVTAISTAVNAIAERDAKIVELNNINSKNAALKSENDALATKLKAKDAE